MKCPYRKETTLIKENRTERTYEEYEECYEEKCPLYYRGKCLRAETHKVQLNKD